MHKTNRFTLYNEDCYEALDNIANNSVDCIITSPPYNFDMSYDMYKDSKPFDEYFEWLDKIFIKCFDKLKDDGRLIINIQPLYSQYIPTHSIITSNLLNIGYKWKGEILWEKNNYNCNYTTWGSWKSPSSPYLKYSWEFIEIFVKSSYKHFGDSKNITISASEFKKWVYAKWSISPEHNMKKYNHPAMFPVELTDRLLKLFTYKDDIILDPFMGTGTTGVSCIKLDREFIGMELSKDYCDKAYERIKETEKEMKRRLF